MIITKTESIAKACGKLLKTELTKQEANHV